MFSRPDHFRTAILSIGSPADDRSVLEELACAQGWKLHFALSCSEAHAAMPGIQPQIILLDRELAPSDWRMAVASLASVSRGACVVLISRVVDDYLWNEVVLYGGYDVLRKPLSEDDVFRIVKLAWAYWRAMHGTGSAATK
jgi:hypothetical protein